MDVTAGAGARLLRVTVADDHDALQLLFDWLRLENGLRGRLRIEASHGGTGGEMGGPLDVLTVALGSGGAGAVFANSLSAWFSQRRANVRVIVTGPGGRSVEVDAQVAKDDVPGLMRDIARLADGPEQQE